MNAKTITLALQAIFIIISTMAIVYFVYSPIPHWDEWPGTVLPMIAMKSGDFSTLFEFHNEHLVFFHKLFIFVDLKLNGGYTGFEIYLNFLFAALICCIFLALFFKNFKLAGNYSNHQFYQVAFFVLGLFFLNLHGHNFQVRFQSSFLLAILLPLLSFYMASKVLAANSWKAFFALCTLMLFSLGTSGMSLFVYLILIPVLLVLQKDYRKNIALGLFSMAALYAYFSAFDSSPSSRFSVAFITENFWNISFFVLKYLGSPFYYLFGKDIVGLGKIAAIALGIAYLGLMVYFTLHVARAKLYKNPVFLTLLLFVWYVCFTAGLTALGRVAYYGTDYAFAQRYVSFTLGGWISLLVIGYFVFPKMERYLFYPFATVLLLGMIFQTYKLRQDHLTPRFQKNMAGLAAELGVRDSAFLQFVYPPDVEVPLHCAKEARLAAIPIMGKEINGLHERLGRNILNYPGALAAKISNIENREAIPNENHFVRISGLLDVPVGSHSFRVVHVVNAQNNIIGFGVTGMPRPETEQNFREDHYLSAFSGYLGITNDTD